MNKLALILGVACLGLSVCLGGIPANAQEPPKSGEAAGRGSHDGRVEWAKKRAAAIRAERRRAAYEAALARARANADFGGPINRK